VRTRVRFGETDAAGIVYYPSYFAWFDSGTHELLRGDDHLARAENGGGPRYPLPIVEAGATFVAPLRFDDIIDIVSTVTELGESTVRVEHEIRTEAGVVAARGFERRVYVENTSGRLRRAPFPVDLRQRLRAHLADPEP
jgi:acyl-CoA thioester hydrolase